MSYFFIKRTLDIFGAIVGLILFSPLFLTIALLIKLDSAGPVFADISERVGKKNNLFRMYKFRSMITNAHSLIRTDPKFKKLYDEYKKGSFKVKTDSDPRVTKIGRFLRKTSIDELPQLINVLKGDMSLVGPRAFHFDELEEQKKRHPNLVKLVEEVLTMKPGITGPWQVSGRSGVEFPERIKLNVVYAREKSLLTDIVILIKTIPAVLRGEGN